MEIKKYVKLSETGQLISTMFLTDEDAAIQVGVILASELPEQPTSVRPLRFDAASNTWSELQPPAPVDIRTLEQAKEQAWNRIKDARDAAVDAGFEYNGLVYDSNAISVQRINGAVTSALIANAADQAFAINWTLADNTVVSLNAEEMIAVGLACSVHIAAQFDKGRTLREQIEAATTNQDTNTITW